MQDHPGEGGGSVAVVLEGAKEPLLLHLPAAPVSFPHLQRLRRQFIGLHRQQMGGMGLGALGSGGGLVASRVKSLFVDWLNDVFQQ